MIGLVTNAKTRNVNDRIYSSSCLLLQKLIFLALMVAMGGAVPGVSHAQSDTERIKELERKLEQSLKTIQDFAARLKELENRTGVRSDTAPPAQSAAPAPQVEDQHEHERRVPTEVGAAPPLPPTVFKGFADVGAIWSGNRGNKGFVDGSFDLYLTPQLSANIKSVIELVFEHSNTGVSSADLERLQVGYAFNDAATVWLGRFHSPFGYWNTAFHHGQQLQTSILRPQMIDFEDRGGVIPAHTVGVWGTGAVRAASGKISYDVVVGSSPSINGNELDPNNSGKSHPGWSSGFNLGYRFGGSAEGLKIGLHGYRADVRDDSVPSNVTRVNIYGGYAAIDSAVWEMIAEYYRFRNEDLSGGTGHFGSWAGFVQLGRHLERWTPYARLEKAALNQADNYFAMLATGRSYNRQAVGLRYDLTANSALKLELNHTRTETALPVGFNQLLMQWAIRF
jgi:hypothetical protein